MNELFPPMPSIGMRRQIAGGDYWADKRQILAAAYNKINAESFDLPKESRRAIEDALYNKVKCEENVTLADALTMVDEQLDHYKMLIPASLFNGM